MVCHLFGIKPLPEPMMTYCQLDLQEQTVKLQWNVILIKEIFIQEKAFENAVYKMAVILSQPSGIFCQFTFEWWLPCITLLMA